MRIDFSALPETVVPGFKGGQGQALIRKFQDPAMGGIVHLTLTPGSSIGLHTHQGNCEVVYVLSGSGRCIDDGAEYPLSPGSVTYCPEGRSHSIVNTGEVPLVLLGVLPNSR